MSVAHPDELAAIDFLCDAAIETPHRFFTEVRHRHGPVAWSSRHRAWVVTGHPELSDALRDRRLSTERMGAFRSRLSGSRAEALAAALTLLEGWMLFHEPPEHTRLRTPIRREFTPKAVAALEPVIRARVEQLVDALPASGRVDLVEAFTHPLPSDVIAGLFGVPDELRDWLEAWSARFGVVVFGQTARSDYDEVARAAGEEFTSVIGELLDRPGEHDDLLSLLMAAEGEVDGLTRLEIIGAASLLLFAGHDTTTSFLGSALMALLDDDEARAALVAAHVSGDDEAVALAVEELLRFESPATAMMRVAVEDHERSGVDIEAGQAVFFNMLAANRDERVFDDPDRLRLDRQPNPHLAFGLGHHFCLGSALARLESRIALPVLLERRPDLRLGSGARFKRDIADRSAELIPVELG